MILSLAAASLARHRLRTALAVAGVSVAAAMLLDMVMLATGMRRSFGPLLLAQGYNIRLAPRGTLPFDTDATVGGAAEIRARLEADRRVEAVSPVLGGQLRVVDGGVGTVAVAIGMDPRVQGDYEVAAGRDVAAPGEMVASADFLRDAGVRIGDTVRVAAGYDPQLRTTMGERALVVVGEASFRYMAAGQRAVALPIATLQAMRGDAGADRASLFMVRLAPGVHADSARAWIEAMLPRVSAISTAEALRQVDERLSYFRQLAYILGSISLLVGFLLVTTLVTVSVNERLGEIAVLRAIGVRRARVVLQVVLEGIALMLAGSAGGLALGLVTGRWLDGILASFPGLPERVSFFVFEPGAAWTALGMLAACGVLAGVYPAWRAASLPIAQTLREEAVA